MDDRFITLKHIDTSIAAKNVAKLLEENKTYFLNGNWGSGKTEFLSEINNNTHKKLVIIDFWRLTDHRSTIEIIFSKLHPWKYRFLRFFIVLCVALSILITNVVDLGLSSFFEFFGVKLIVGSIVLLVAIYQFFKIKSDGFYSYLLTFKYLSLTRNVLVIDDFDRMSNNQQEESYKVFSLLNGKLPIIFVGDIEKVHLNDNNFLSKIIDRRIELPFVLHPSNIWQDYFELLSKKLNMSLSDDFWRRFSFENRNLRDRNHFNDYVNQEFFSRGKLGHVQEEQQLWIIYAYLFYPELYQQLLKNEEIKVKDDEKTSFIGMFKFGRSIQEILSDIQQSDFNQYPPSYKKNRLAYFLYEESLNRTKEEFDTLLEINGEKLSRELREANYNTDFYQYLSSEYNSLSNPLKERLLRLTIQESMKSFNSPAMNYIVEEKLSEEIPSYERNSPLSKETIVRIVDFWESILKNEGLDKSEIIYFMEKHRVLSFYDLGLHYTKLEINNENFAKLNRKDFFLLTYLSAVNKFGQFKTWDSSIWHAIDSFGDKEFLSFWKFQSILSSDDNYFDFDIVSSNKTYILWVARYELEPPHKLENYREDVIEKIRPKLEQLKSKGFTFVEKIDGEHRRRD
ncbi:MULTISPECIES: P-loop NTPase fold protein [Bacilli]|jgi:KAP family P-loop domain protein|uniref:P-loop NTPase fold protein n=1 Tax=Bacilli TaxID=91061 RepID=UPI00066DE5A2|nr:MULTISPECIES: P-loop NTPase fold protein [Bacilli]MDN3291667.1 P-loop NTPase fold protein [Streptococcus sp.]